MKQKGKIFSILLAVAMIISIVPCMAFATEGEDSSNKKCTIRNDSQDLIEVLGVEMTGDKNHISADVAKGTTIKIKFKGTRQKEQFAVLDISKRSNYDSIQTAIFDDTNMITFTVNENIILYCSVKPLNIKITEDGVSKIIPHKFLDDEALEKFNTLEYIVAGDVSEYTCKIGTPVTETVILNLNNKLCELNQNHILGKNIYLVGSGILCGSPIFESNKTIYLDGKIKYTIPIKVSNENTEETIIHVNDGIFSNNGHAFNRGYTALSVGKDQVKISGGIFNHEFVDDKDYNDPEDYRNDINWVEKGCRIERGKLDANDNWIADPEGSLYKVISFKVLDGADQTVTDLAKGLTIRLEGAIKDLLNIFVDGKLVDPSNYTLTEGSIIVNFHEDFLKSLGNGKHDVTFNFNGDKSTKTTFTLAAPETKPVTKPEATKPAEKIADTSDTSAIITWTVSLATAGIAAVVLKKKVHE